MNLCDAEMTFIVHGVEVRYNTNSHVLQLLIYYLTG